MPLKLRVETELDERSATSAANKAQQVFEESARNASRVWRQSFTDGMRGVEDSIKNVTKLEKELDDLRRGGAGVAAVAVQSQRIRDAKKSEADAVKEAAAAYNAASGAAGLMEKALAGMAQGAGLGVNASENLASSMTGAGGKALLAATGIAAIGTAAVVVGKQLYNLGAQFDAMSDGITAKTGIMGDQLNTMMEQVKNVGRSAAIPLEDIAGISAGVAQSLHLSGDAALAMTQKLADLQQVTGQGVDIRGLGKAFRLFDIKDAQDQVTALKGLVTASQDTGKPINELINSLQTSGRTAKEFNLSLGQTVGLLSTFEDAGLDADSAATGLGVALKNIAHRGGDPQQGLEDVITKIKQFHDAGNEAGAVNLASSTFARSYKEFLPVIESGTLDIKQLHNEINKIADGDPIEKEKQATADWNEQWTILGNTLRSDVEPAATMVFAGINKELAFGLDKLEKIGQKWKDLTALFAGPSPQLPSDASTHFGVGPMGAPGSLRPVGPGGNPLAPDNPLSPGFRTPLKPGDKWTPGPGLPELQWEAGKGWVPVPDTSKAPKGPRLGEVPSLPYDTTLPPGAANLPQTSAIVSAENSYLDARHTLAEKQARLQQLEQDTNATANDIQKAKNDVLNAQQAQQQAELRMADAAQNLYDQQNKQLNQYANDMGEIGAKLDKDFGISKGLAGVAENLFKFLADLAFAPALGAMKGAQAGLGYNPATGGQGLIGIAAAQGAFGPQFTPAAGAGAPPGSARSATSSTTGAVGSGGYPGDAALLANVPSGSYAYGGGDLAKGLTDCSGAVTDLVNIFDTGSTTAAHDASTGDLAQWLTQRGFLPTNVPMPGTFQVGLNAEHTQATLPGGTNFNWGNDTDAANRGVAPGSGGAWMPGFTQHFYRPVGGAGSTASFGAGSASGGIPIPLPVTIVGGAGISGVGGVGGAGGPGVPGGLSPEQWNKIAGAEASGNWAKNSGNGYSGGLQFDPKTWNSYGGGQYAPQAWQATPEQQMAIGDKVLAGQGPGAWPTTSALHPDWFQPGGAPGQPGGGPLTVTGNPALGGPTFPGNTSPGLTNPAGAGSATAPGQKDQGGYVDPRTGKWIPVGPTPGSLPAPGIPTGAAPSTVNGAPPSDPFAQGPLAALPSQGFGGTGLPFGLSPGVGAVGEGGIGGGPGTTLIGGMAPPQGTGKGGININSGILGAAGGAGAGAANIIPGAGAAIQIGIQEAARAIQYGSQVAGIAVSGLQETFGFGKNTPLAQSGWGEKILGGLVGAGVMLPNVAGSGGQDKAKGLTADQQAQQKAGEKGGQPLTPEQVAAQQKQGAGGGGQGAGQGNPVTNHFNIDNSGRTEAGTGRDAAWYINQQQAQYAPAAMP